MACMCILFIYCVFFFVFEVCIGKVISYYLRVDFLVQKPPEFPKICKFRKPRHPDQP
jgi:hypothetical protein